MAAEIIFLSIPIVVALAGMLGVLIIGPPGRDDGVRVPYVTTELATAVMRAEHILAREDRMDDAEDCGRKGMAVMLKVTAMHLDSQGCVLMSKAVREAIEIVAKEAANG